MLRLLDRFFASRTDRTLASKEATIAVQVHRENAELYLNRKLLRQRHPRMRRVIRMALRQVLLGRAVKAAQRNADARTQVSPGVRS